MNCTIDSICLECTARRFPSYTDNVQCSTCREHDHFEPDSLYPTIVMPRKNGYSAQREVFKSIVSELYGRRTPVIQNVIFNDPATIVLWSDGTKTVVKCQEGDIFDPEKGLAMAITKKFFGNKGSYCNEIKK